jgi:Fe-S-cluster containining protein
VFFNDGYQLALSEISGEADTGSIFRGLEKMNQAVDLLIDSLLNYAEKQGIRVACHKGCGWCCHQTVYANSYEMHYLAEYIKSNFTEEEQQKAMERAQQKNEKVKSLSDTEVLNYKSPCPLLVEGTCSAYKARPMACRIYLSTRLESCIEFFHHPENEKNYPALLDFPLMAGRMMNEGFIEALKEKEVMTAEFRLEEGLSITLDKNCPKPGYLNVFSE